ncbi:hypothetical protein K2P47_02270 [Patescibacteria group bacterium]|nr:hypothetical protein [Patescibacteria group bacterium]
MPKGVEVQVLSWAQNKKLCFSAKFFILVRGLEKVASSFEKRATTYTEHVMFKSSPGHIDVN